MLLPVAFAIALAACEDHQLVTGAQRFRLKRVVITNTSADTLVSTTTYTYDSAGKLVRFNYNTGTTPLDRIYALQYDNQGRLMRKEGTNAAGLVTERTTYNYQANGTVSSIQFFSNPDQAGTLRLAYTVTLDYGPDKQPIKQTATSAGDSLMTNVLLYTYADGNIVRIDHPNPNPNQSYYELVMYDDKPNPYYGLIGSRDNVFETVNKNNPVRFREQLEYENGLLVKLTFFRFSVQIMYEYELY